MGGACMQILKSRNSSPNLETKIPKSQNPENQPETTKERKRRKKRRRGRSSRQKEV